MATTNDPSKLYDKLKKVHDKNGEIEYSAEIPAAAIEQYMADAAEELAQDLTLPGFRKGKVPEKIAREHFGEMYLLEAAADSLLRDAMKAITYDEELRIVGKPQLVITKIAPKNPLEFRVRFALYPDVSLPDYKKIARQIVERKESTEVTDKEIDEAIDRVRRLMADATGGEGSPLPELNEEFVKKLGPFKDVPSFREELKKQLVQEKAANDKDLKRDLIVKGIVDATKVKIPAMLVEQEYEDFVAHRDEELKRANLSLEEYLKQMKKEAATQEKEDRAGVEEQIKTSLVMSEIRKAEDITPNEREVQIGIARLMARYPDREERTIRETAEAIAMQEELFKLLEGEAPKGASKDAK